MRREDAEGRAAVAKVSAPYKGFATAPIFSRHFLKLEL
jgi:hypothetical protein